MAVADSLDILKDNYPELSEVFRTHWQTRLVDYSAELYRADRHELEPELTEALGEELTAMGLSPAKVDKALYQLQQTPVLQTSHHITPTHGPTFLALDLICLTGLDAEDLYLVGANSGVSFSNSAWSGALSYGDLPLEKLVDLRSDFFRQVEKSQAERLAHGDPDSRISIIPARQRDQLVFATKMTDFQADRYRKLSPLLRDLLPTVQSGQLFSQWSARAAAGIQNRVLGTDQVLVFDINRVIAHYLIDILSAGSDHPCCELLSDSAASRKVRRIFNDPVMFLGNYTGKKSNKVDSLTWTGDGLASRKQEFQALDRAGLIRKLQGGELCPGIFLLFFVLRFINGIRCLGSFSQIGYLETFRRQWDAVDLPWNLDLEPDYSVSLSTGRLYQDGSAIWPMDLAIAGRQLSVESYADTEMSVFWEPILQQLTGAQ